MVNIIFKRIFVNFIFCFQNEALRFFISVMKGCCVLLYHLRRSEITSFANAWQYLSKGFPILPLLTRGKKSLALSVNMEGAAMLFLLIFLFLDVRWFVFQLYIESPGYLRDRPRNAVLLSVL